MIFYCIIISLLISIFILYLINLYCKLTIKKEIKEVEKMLNNLNKELKWEYGNTQPKKKVVVKSNEK